ncbi:sigma-54-dependent transcriptional regulator [Celeribacter neptunius]|uniref:Two-component system, NtrC family, C4-dicarboxylate transport response regulator DctD n=1 Tax=Celeribacter neptunius TaxID=588602 RepID=A0A1I3VPK5_9RHOB|nr:sigma-54 dependent transcriptional regulator [Celeribacter neptunius]SFJ97328.1 two-component system, NtrC family, C4-dicarboxylate transport response regulator DctD [Celeribacter neptunius]
MNEAALRILVVDDDKAMRSSLVDLLEAAGHEAEALSRADQVAEKLPEMVPDVILSDVRMPGMSGLELLATLPPEAPPLVLISAHGDIATAVQAMQDGAYSFVEKPYEPRRLLTILSHAGAQHRLHQRTERLKARLRDLSGLDKLFLGQSAAARAVREEVLSLSESPASVLLVGETGTGKDVLARALHDLGPHAEGPFVAFNCATLTPEGFEREMFGAEGGPQGKLAAADGGTLFLDEVCACPLPVQAMLLRVLEQREITPVGSSRPRRLAFRVISATNEDPEAAVEAGQLRLDFLHRLNTMSLSLPTLRERRDDILLLFTHFCGEFARIYELEVPEPSAEDLAALMSHGWPGNVRELRNVAERFVLRMRRGQASVAAALRADHLDDVPDTLREAVAVFEREVIGRALRAHEGRMDAVAEALGIGRRTLNEKIVKLGLNKDALL